ncbi:MAG: hypothetical protein IJ839_08105 [Ruminobacter sp.]|jgi:FtsZ-binding cell division protein ZapB|nr:hypothetical protein [Ruminobacter sp.]
MDKKNIELDDSQTEILDRIENIKRSFLEKSDRLNKSMITRENKLSAEITRISAEKNNLMKDNQNLRESISVWQKRISMSINKIKDDN